MAGFIDIACNFTHESFKRNLEEVINNAEHAGVEKFVLLCASLTDLDPIKQIQNNAPNKFFISAGIHPHHATETVEINYDQLLSQLQSITPHAIGETGLDYFRNISPPDIQKKSFRMHIEIAKELNTALINVALAWVIQQKNITTTVVGARRVDQVKEFYAAGEITLTPDQLERLNEESILFHGGSGTGIR